MASTSLKSLKATAFSPVITTAGVSTSPKITSLSYTSNGYRVYKYTASGSITF
jgi:hypothetical protein